MIKINKLPNILSISRIFLSPFLLFTKPLSLSFFILYTICGTSDILDGYIARKFNCYSKLGSFLDSIGDIIFVIVAFIIFLPKIILPKFVFVWIILIALIRLITCIFGIYKFNKAYFLHTYLNKLTGFLLFLFPFLYYLISLTSTAILICIIASLCALEDLLITIISKDFSPDIKSIFSMKKSYKN